jgi:hypothetical protein
MSLKEVIGKLNPLGGNDVLRRSSLFLVSAGLVLGGALFLNVGSVFAAACSPTSGANVTLSASSCTLASGNYNYTGTLTISGTIVAGTAATSPSQVYIHSDSIVITSSGYINATGTGYITGTGTTGPGPGGGGAGAHMGGGGGHGGAGGRGIYNGSADGAAGLVNDSASSPAYAGSASGRGTGGNGGAYVNLNATNSITINGTVSANGELATDTNHSGGSGAGGTVYLNAPYVYGNGSITANGGNSGSGATDTLGGGCGGGGIVAYAGGSWAYTGSVTASAGAGCGGIRTAYDGYTIGGITSNTVTVTSPNTAVTWYDNTTQSITWGHTGTGIDHYIVYYSTTGPSGPYTSIYTSGAGTGALSSYSWTIPNSLSTSQARIKVEAYDAASNLLYSDFSDNNFTIAPVTVTVTAPSGGSLGAGANPSISWSASGSGISYYKIFLSNDGYSSYPTQIGGNISSSPYTGWTVPNTAGTYKIQINAYNSSGTLLASTVSASAFTIVASSVLTSITIADTGGYTANATPSITLAYTGGTPTTMQFSCDGTNWSTPVTYASATTSFNITNGATNCTTANGSKTIYAQIINAGGTSSSQSDTTYYDTTGPTVSSFTANTLSASQVQLAVTASDAGAGLHATSPYIYYGSAGATCTHTSNSGYLSTNPYTWTGLGANTQYSFDAKARDVFGTPSAAYSTCVTLYTSSATPGAPTVNSPTGTTINVNPSAVSGDGEMAIYVSNSAANCSAATGGGYVQSGGNLSSSAVWQLDAAWGTKTVTGLSTGVTYYACAKARNGDGIETVFGSSGSASTVVPPSLTSISIANTNGYTSDATPSITLAYTGGTPTTMQFSCDNTNWSTPITYASPTSGFNITNGATNCTTANGSKTIYAEIINAGGTSSSQNATTYYDTTGPTVSSFTINTIATSQVQLAVTANDGSGVGLHATTPYLYYESSGATCTHANNSGWISNNPYIWISLGANTQYSFDAKARDVFGTASSAYSTCVTLYTSSVTPGAPTVNSPTGTTINVNPPAVSGGGEMAIYVSNSDANCLAATGGGYVQSGGNLSSSAIWQTDATWGTKTVTGLTAGNTYYACVKARNGDNVETAFGPSGSASTVVPPSLTSISIANTNGYTNDATPSITLAYTGGTPTTMQFSCDGTNWSTPITYASPTSGFNITNGATNCTTANGSKTIYAEIINAGGTSSSQNATTYYDTTGPTVSSFTANTLSTSQIQLAVTADDGSGAGLHATPYLYGGHAGATCDNTTTYGWYSTNSYIWIGFSPNTQISFDVKARDALANAGGYSTCRTVYTLANKPNTPVLSTPTINTINVNPAAGSGGGEMAIYAATGLSSNCDGTNGIGYVQTDGSIGGTEAWQTDATWGTETVTGLSPGTAYYFCAKARNGDNVETVFGDSASATTNGSIIYINSLAISDTNGYTSDSTPLITLSYSGGIALYMGFSCDGGINWSSDITYASSTSAFNITTGATGCTTASGIKTITARVKSSDGYSGNTVSATTYYDKTGPIASSFIADNTSSSQVRLSITADDGDGVGIHTTSPYLYARTTGSACSHTTGFVTSNYWVSTNPVTWGGLAANTQYSFDSKARDKFSNQGSYSSCITLYTSAKTPVAPIISNRKDTTVDVNPVSGGAEKDISIYAATGLTTNCNGTNGIGYVQADGSIGSTPVWQTDEAWGTKTVTGLTGNTTYYFCAQARNQEDMLTSFGKTTSVTLLNLSNPVPSISSLSPTSVNGSFKDDTVSGFTLTVNGSNFVNGSVVRWDGTDRVTTYVSATRLTAAILSSDLTDYRPVPVTVFSPLPAGGISGQKIFTVLDPLPIATHFTPEHGSTDFEAENSLLNVQEVTLANPAGSIEWQVPVTVKSQNFDSNVKVGEGYISINKTSLDSSLDSTARVSMHVLDCASYKIYYSSGFKSSLNDVKASNHECNATTSPACTNMVCADNTLTFDVPHFDSYGSEGFVASDSKGIPTTLAIPNAVPVITAGPSDGGSSATTPTNEGSDVHFTATAIDGNTDGYFLKICKTNSITPNVYAPPDCAESQQICTSAEAASGTTASCDFNTLGFIGESQDWYAFICDYNADPLCSAAVQGSGVNGSPFSVNHAGSFGTVIVTNTLDGEIVPGDTLKFRLPGAQITDPDNGGSQTLLTMHICTEGTTSYDYTTNTCTGGTEVCSSPSVDPTLQDATCTGGASLVSVPTAHGNYGFKVYVEDNHDFPAVGNNSQTYSVTDVPPQVMSYFGPDAPAPAAGGSDDITFSVTVHDDNGDNDITAVNGVFYNTAATGLDSGICTSSENNCYLAASCTPANVSAPGTGKTALGSDNELTASCTVTVWFNADYSDGWKAHVNVSDGTHNITSSADSGAVTNPALLGINVSEAGIVYGTVAIGGTSQAEETSMGNMGNQTLDVYVNGTPMTAGSYSIPVSQQKWYHTADPFDWDSAPSSEGPFTLTQTPSGTTDGGGCLNRDIQVRPVHDSLSTNESIYWKLRIPANQHAGSYSGQNTFSTTSGDTCTGAEF